MNKQILFACERLLINYFVRENLKVQLETWIMIGEEVQNKKKKEKGKRKLSNKFFFYFL